MVNHMMYDVGANDYHYEPDKTFETLAVDRLTGYDSNGMEIDTGIVKDSDPDFTYDFDNDLTDIDSGMDDIIMGPYISEPVVDSYNEPESIWGIDV